MTIMFKRKLWGDLETFSATPLKHGTYIYAANAEIMLFAYALDDGPVACWDLTAGEPMPADLEDALLDESCEVIFQNSMFDRSVMRLAVNTNAAMRTAGEQIARWRDSMVQALAHSLPGALDKLCVILRIDEADAKMSDGKQLVQLFCKPRPKNQKLRRATRLTDPVLWEKFKVYAIRDVGSMRKVVAKLPTWNYSGRELELWHLDQKINDRGFYVDVELAQAAIRAVALEQKKLAKRTQELTAGDVEKATQRDALLAHLLNFYGVTLPDLRGDTLERRINDPELPEPVRELLAIRQQSATSSTSKYNALVRGVNTDHRLRGTMQFDGAMRTGRWAGRTFQPQNLPRVPRHLKKEIERGIEAIKADAAEVLYENVMELASSCIRGALIAPPGRKLCVADLSNIEGRKLAWLANQEWKLEAFAAADENPEDKTRDLYCIGYARSFGVTVQEVVADDDAGGTMRLIGKVQELALGYQGAVGAYGSMAALYGIELPDDRILPIVRAWRAANDMIVGLWYALEATVKSAIRSPGNVALCDHVRVKRNGKWVEIGLPSDRVLKVQRTGAWLRVRLPSGRNLCYPFPKLDDEGKITYMGVNQYTRKWQRLHTYGGKLVENVTQASARDVLGYNMPAIDAAGYEIVLDVHDEVITETPDTDEFTAGELARLLSACPPWAPGLPLSSKGYETYRYRKD